MAALTKVEFYLEDDIEGVHGLDILAAIRTCTSYTTAEDPDPENGSRICHLERVGGEGSTVAANTYAGKLVAE